ncbi:MAG: hypothetical protein JXQ87_02435 [Bacteroidia bacterium]
MDSRWVFGIDHKLNQKRPAFDERSQKTNYLVSQKPTFNNLILGSSRASYLPTKTLKGKWFNYAVSGMYPDEYLGYAKIAQDYSENHRLDTIIIGLDFWATCQCAIVSYKSPNKVLDDSKSWLNQITNLLSKDALHESLRTFHLNKGSFEYEAFYKLPYLEKNRTQGSDSLKTIKIKEQLWYYQKDVFGDEYNFNPDYLVPLEELISSFPNTHFIIFTSPVSPKLSTLQNMLGRQADRQNWHHQIKKLNAELIIIEKDKFNNSMFFDAHHLRPEFFKLIFE